MLRCKALGLEVKPRDFAENLNVESLEIHSLPVRRRLITTSGVILEVTQIGKECHDRYAIYRQVGTCVMLTEGVLTRVIRGGVIYPGDEIMVV